jgi:amidohydrolase
MPDLAVIKSSIVREVDSIRPAVEKVSADIHAQPELAFEERQASAWLTTLLSANGFGVEREVANLPTAFRADHRGGKGPTIALLAEYDALPGVGHGCGHNLICTAACAAGIALKNAWPDCPGTIVVMGTPAEEDGGGKILMLDRGAFQGVDVAMMFHPGFENRVDSPSLACVEFTITFSGKAAHSALAPWEGRNAADAAMLFFAGVNALRQHLQPDARLHGIIREAGVKANVVPYQSRVEFIVRSERSERMDEMVTQVLEIAQGAALMTKTTVGHELGLPYLDARRCPSLGAVAEVNCTALGVKTVPVTPSTPRASGDAGNVSHVLPTLGIQLGISGERIPGHSPENRDAAISPMGQEAMITAAKILALSCADIFADPDLLDRIRAEHKLVAGASAVADGSS